MPEDVTFCGVFDGHGPHGHLVARKVREALPVKLLSFLNSSELKQNGSSTSCCSGNHKSDGGDREQGGSKDDKVDLLWREAFLKSYKAMDKELRSHPNLDSFCSGSTAVTIVKQVWQKYYREFCFIFHFVASYRISSCLMFECKGSNLYMGNIGDSRAILGSMDSNNSMVATQLTVDLKPDLPSTF